MITQRFLAELKICACFTFMDLLILFFLKENYKMTFEITSVKLEYIIGDRSQEKLFLHLDEMYLWMLCLTNGTYVGP